MKNASLGGVRRLGKKVISIADTSMIQESPHEINGEEINKKW
jgi:hypothetical protein